MLRLSGAASQPRCRRSDQAAGGGRCACCRTQGPTAGAACLRREREEGGRARRSRSRRAGRCERREVRWRPAQGQPQGLLWPARQRHCRRRTPRSERSMRSTMDHRSPCFGSPALRGAPWPALANRYLRSLRRAGLRCPSAAESSSASLRSPAWHRWQSRKAGTPPKTTRRKLFECREPLVDYRSSIHFCARSN